MQKVEQIQTVELPRKNPRIQIAIPQEVLERLEALADGDGRPVGNLGAMLVQAAIELIDAQGYTLVKGKLRRVAVIKDEDDGDE